MPSVRFVNMWAGFSPANNPLLRILEAAVPARWHVVSDRRSGVDLEIGSVYPSRLDMLSALGKAAVRRGVLLNPADARESFVSAGRSATARAGIWYTPENRRPPTVGWDATLSFESSAWPDNEYLPFWQLNSDLFGGESTGLLGDTLRIDALTMSRQAKTSRRSGFCCAILRNPEPVRLRMIESLRKVGPVDVFGPLARRPIVSKMEVLRNYRFALVFENDLYPGYVTEKPFDAWHCGAIPLYWGLDPLNYLNPDAVLNMAAMSGPMEMVDTVADIERSSDAIDFIASQPILLRRPPAEPVFKLVRTVLGLQSGTPA